MAPWIRRVRPRRWWHWAVVGVVALAVIGGIGSASSHEATAPTAHKTTGSGASDTTTGRVKASRSTRPRPAAAARTRTTTTAVAQATTATAAPNGPAAASPASARQGRACRGRDPLANVYHPYRLRVENPCLTVTGTVAYIRREDDGDVHFDLSMPASEAQLLDRANYSQEDGQLVAEIVPADQPGCTPGQPPPLPPTAYRSSSYDYGTCTGADTATPPLGAQVSITGPYVLDSDHGWMEVHPVWAVTVVAAPPSSPVTAEAPPATSASEPTQPKGGSSAWCQASAAASSDGYPGDYEVYVHSNQPDTKAAASDAGDTWSEHTDSSGYADIRLYHTSPGMTITVTVGGATCSTTA